MPDGRKQEVDGFCRRRHESVSGASDQRHSHSRLKCRPYVMKLGKRPTIPLHFSALKLGGGTGFCAERMTGVRAVANAVAIKMLLFISNPPLSVTYRAPEWRTGYLEFTPGNSETRAKGYAQNVHNMCCT